MDRLHSRARTRAPLCVACWRMRRIREGSKLRFSFMRWLYDQPTACGLKRWNHLPTATSRPNLAPSYTHAKYVDTRSHRWRAKVDPAASVLFMGENGKTCDMPGREAGRRYSTRARRESAGGVEWRVQGAWIGDALRREYCRWLVEAMVILHPLAHPPCHMHKHMARSPMCAHGHL